MMMTCKRGIVCFSILAVYLWAWAGGCSPSRVDKTEAFAMAMNGHPFKIKLGTPKGLIQEVEAGYSDSHLFSVSFPASALNRFGERGFRLHFDVTKLVMGRVIETKGTDPNYWLRVSFFPILGHRVNEGLMLEYSSRYKEGYMKVRFDIVEPEFGGRIKGVILEAVLYAYYLREDSREPIETNSPRKLEIFNFLFDTTFERQMF